MLVQKIFGGFHCQTKSGGKGHGHQVHADEAVLESRSRNWFSEWLDVVFGVVIKSALKIYFMQKCVMSEMESANLPGPSRIEDEVKDESLHSDVSKLRLKDALLHFQQRLVENDLVASESSTAITEEAMLMADKLFDNCMEMLAEMKITEEEELILNNDIDAENLFEEVGDVSEVSSEGSSDDYEPEEKKEKLVEYIPLEYKIKVVNIAKKHPGRSLKVLQRQGCHRLKYMKDIPRWEESIKSGGTLIDKYNTIDSWTYDRFTEARENNQQVSTRNLQQWGLSAASQFPDLNFKASETWVQEFKRKHRIRQRKITKYITERETVTVEETLALAENFRKQIRALIPKFNKDFIMNTDQTGMLINFCILFLHIVVN